MLRHWNWVIAVVVVLGLSTTVAANVDVIYTDMLEAYELGQLELARNLADQYIDRFSNEMSMANNDPDREGAMIRLLGAVKSALQYENRQEASSRLANDQELINKFEEGLLAAQEMYPDLQPHEQSQKMFIEREVGRTAIELIKAREELSARSTLNSLYDTFQSEIEKVTTDGVDAILDREVSGPSPPDVPQLELNSDEQEQILSLVRDYFDGLVNGDLAKISRVTGYSAARSSDLMQRYDADCAQAEVQTITAFTLPEITESTLVVTQLDRDQGLYGISLRGIELKVIETDGNDVVRTVNKHMRFSKNADGAWTVRLPND